jgi:hypothetical protein
VVAIRGVLFHVPFSHLPIAFSAVQTIVKLIRPKGRSMRKYKSGLHTDVPAIFDGVWNPETDNIFHVPTANKVARVDPTPGPQAPAQRRPKEHRSAAGFFTACKDASSHLFSSRSRRERRRLSSISKHLMINIQS